MIIKIDVEGSECVVISFLTLILFRLGDGVPGTPPLTFFADNSKSIGLRLLKFFDFSNYHMPLTLGLKRGFYTNYLSPWHTAWMSYFTFTQLNLYLYQLQDIGFQLLIALWKALNIRKPIAQFLRRNFASDAFKENLHILPWQGLFKNV